MNSLKKGFSLLELIITLAIVAIIAYPLITALKSTLYSWKEGSNSLRLAKETHFSLSSATEKLHFIESINNVSLSSNPYGYITFTDKAQRTYSMFLNNASNQTYLNASNTFPNNSLVFMYHANPPSIELLLQNTPQFRIETYTESPNLYFKVSTPNNLTTPNYRTIDSLKLILSTNINQQVEYLEQLIDIAKTPIAQSGSQTIGDENTLFANTFSSVSNIAFKDTPNGSGDSISIQKSDYTVKIQHTGTFFSSISDAIEQTVSGDIILIAHTQDGYNETLTIPKGITLKGGYNSQTWERDLDAYPTHLIIREGISLSNGKTAAIVMEDNTTIDGLNIDSKNLECGIYANNITEPITIRNTSIINNDIGILSNNTPISISNSAITSNMHCVYSTHSSRVSCKRNRLFSKNINSNETIFLSNISELDFTNNLIINGYYGLYLSSISSAIVAHNVIAEAQNFGLYLSDMHNTEIHSNVLALNNIGIFFNTDAPGTLLAGNINNNFIVNTIFGDTINLTLNGTNISESISDYQWNYANPYFSNVSNYMLKTSSSLIDAGYYSNELFTNNNPSQGTSQNDIGLYGGNHSGRIGPAKTTKLTTLMTPTAIHSAITTTYPGDFIHFDEGSFDVAFPITLKPHQSLSGTYPSLSILNHLSSTSLILTDDHTSIEHLRIQANNKVAISSIDKSHVSIKEIILENASTAILSETQGTSIKHCTFYNCTIGLHQSADTPSQVRYIIAENCAIGLKNSRPTPIDSQYNFFYDTATLYSGNIASNNDTHSTASLIRAPHNSRFELQPTSSAINCNNNYDAGALEFIHQQAMITLSPLESSIDRFFKTIELELLHSENTKQVLSELSIGFYNNQQSTTLNAILTVDSETLESFTASLPSSIIADDLTLKLQLDSYSFNHSMLIDTITLSW